jgi:Flp pilus assembly protein TadG
MRPSAERRASGDRGAALVEFAVIAPLLFFLILAMVDFGFAYGDYIGVRSGAREGARQAAINPPGSRSCTLDTAAPNAATANLACLTKERIGLPAGEIEVAITLLDGDDPGTVPGEAGDPVRVCARIPAKSTSGMTAPFLDGKHITSKTEMRLEVRPTYLSFAEGGLSC